MNCKRSIRYFTLTLILVFGITGCASHRPVTDPALDRQAFARGVDAASCNQDISSSKGSGWAILQTPEKTEKYRFAWAVVHPNAIRMTFFSSGLPIETILMFKDVITFLSHTGRHDRYSYYSLDPDMERFIQVPVKMSEIILILLGRTPIKSFDDAYYTSTDETRPAVTLKNISENHTQYLQFDSKGHLKSLTVTDFLKNTVYSLTVNQYKTFDDRQIPAQIIIADAFQRKLTLDITDFKVNPEIKETVFKLTGL
ncbi:MAG: DUF4292 domain-containing protein [Proteobacteria bacterium]|nr:DUF4292 domain-containing protein [Pseudomonadota bacterium]MBU1388870.1 DUF4292 domain-containing protein [Pseudomonadota bacterium]MBU1542251.1 DUF4292 domain-containing protein [Pseudomonadota bacterium]MBU2480459.1 DUF4292 domain-containing protein [Pseudomonadota bacterium]